LKRLSSRRTKIWHKDYLVYKYLWPNLTSSINSVLTTINSKKPVVLDIGCGEKPYKDMFGNCQYVGVNYSQDGASPEIVGDALNLPIKSASVDIVLCSQVIEHVPDPKKLIKESYRVLKSGGGLILTGPFYWPLHEEPYDFYRFTYYGFEYLLKHIGYKSIDIKADGNDWIQIMVSVNLRMPNYLFPIRVFLNTLGLFLGHISNQVKSPLNYTATCYKLT